MSPEPQAIEAFNWQTPHREHNSPTTLRGEQDLEEEKKELLRLDLLFNLLVRRNIERPDQLDKNMQAHGISYKFYQTKKVFKFRRMNDIKIPLINNVLAYISHVKSQIKFQKDPLAHILRKNDVFLKRKVRQDLEAMVTEDLKQKLTKTKEDYRSLRSLLLSKPDHREKSLLEWLGFVCTKCMSPKRQKAKPKSPSPRKSSRRKPSKEIKPKPEIVMKNIEELLKQNESKITHISAAIRHHVNGSPEA